MNVWKSRLNLFLENSLKVFCSCLKLKCGENSIVLNFLIAARRRIVRPRDRMTKLINGSESQTAGASKGLKKPKLFYWFSRTGKVTSKLQKAGDIGFEQLDIQHLPTELFVYICQFLTPTELLKIPQVRFLVV